MLPITRAPDWRLRKHVLCQTIELTRIARLCRLELYDGMEQHSQGAVPECPALLLSGYYRHSVFRAGEGNDSASAKTGK